MAQNAQDACDLDSDHKTPNQIETAYLELSALLLIGLIVIGSLWLASGTNAILFWERSIAFSVSTIALCIGWLFLNKRNTTKTLLSLPKAKELKTSYFLALAGLVPCLALLAIFSKMHPTLYTSPGALPEFFSEFHLIQILFLGFTAYVSEFFLRDFMAEKWGSGNFSLLEALVLGVAFQNVSIFLVILGAGLASSHVKRKWDIKIAALSRFFWLVLLLIGLHIFNHS